MASTGNSNQQGAQFDMNKFFKPTTNLASPNPNANSNMGTAPYPPTTASYAVTPSASYPPPTGPFSYPPPTPPFYHMPPVPQDQLSSLHQQRSVSFPTPPLQPVSIPPSPQNPNAGARLMALLSAPPSNFEYSHQHAAPLPSAPPSSSEFSVSQPLHAVHAAIGQSAPVRMLSSKLPRGRHLVGNHVVYDVDVRMQGEEQPQLEVTPITKYVSDPGLILGHQIAVNKTYICYGLKLGAIRVLNINTALRSLLRGHTQRVTDMAFFAEDVHLLASASVDGRVYVWKISEGPDEEEKPQISGNVVIAIDIVGEEGSIHPRICWHCHKQEILVVAIGRSVLRIDTTKVGKGVTFTAEEPLQCHIDKLMDGIQLVGKHDGEVTDLSMCQWMTTRLVSASKDGTVKIWEDRKAMPLLVLRPHHGQPVDAAKFITAPHRPDHVILITSGPQNREVKLWASSDEEGWLLPSDAESWRCTQTLELKSSIEPRNEEAFFNQVVALSQAGLLLLANARKNAIYAVHLEYGANPAATRMDYLAEFTVTMPILSFTGTSDILPHGEQLVQVYCVQTQAIQQYALDLSQCLPPPMENLGIEKSDSTVSHDVTEGFPMLDSTGSKTFDVPLPSSSPKTNNQMKPESSLEIKCHVNSAFDSAALQEVSTSSMESNSASLLSTTSRADVPVPSPPLPLSPRLSHKPSDLGGDQAITDYSVDRQMDGAQTTSSGIPLSNDNGTPQDKVSDVLNPPVRFKHPTHLITPSEIMATSSSQATHINEGKCEGEAKIRDVISNHSGNVEVEVKVVGESGFSNHGDSVSQVDSQIKDKKETSFYSQASDLGADMTRECCELPAGTSVVEDAQDSVMAVFAQPSNSGEDNDDDEATNDIPRKDSDVAVSVVVPQSPAPAAKGKKQKGKNLQMSAQSSPSPSVSNLADSLNAGSSSNVTSSEAAFPQILAMQENINQLVTMQKEMQKQMTMMVAVPLTKEGKRLEAALGRSMEKAMKANADALWARFQEESAKQDKLLRDRTQQITNLISNSINKDLLAVLERNLKKEIAAVGTTVARTISPILEKTISTAITDCFQRGIGDKAVNQLERSVTSKLEATVARQIQAQFQTSGKQALQDGLKSSLEASVVPAFEMSCKAMFEQVDAAFKKGMVEHTAAAQHQLDSSYSSLALTLREAINSASSVTQKLTGELADGQRKLLALAASGPTPQPGIPLVPQPSTGPIAGIHEKVEQPFDPMKELSRLVAERKYEEAFTSALQRSDVSIVSWLCSQVDLQRILSTVPLPLSQGVLLSLLQQLACDITTDTTRKLAWMTDVTANINPHDQMIAVHVRPIFEQVYQILNHHRTLPTVTPAELASIRIVMHVINSMLMTCK